jgi:hypothetical protein
MALPEPRTVAFDSWAEFQDFVADPGYRNWAFRGQADARWPLHSSLSRYLLDHRIHRDAWPIQEERIGRIFRRKGHLFLDHIPDEDDAFQWLALMQHHGAPTRLLDFTWSPFVAAFFALERATVPAAVWAISFPEVWRAEHRLPGRRGTVRAEDLAMRTPGVYQEVFLPNTLPFVSAGEPMIMNQRLVAQSGTFVVPGVLDRPVEDLLAAYPAPDETVLKLLLDTERMRDEAMYALYSMNLTNATLFPGIDGMARSLAYELEFHWGFDPKTMTPHPGMEPRPPRRPAAGAKAPPAGDRRRARGR